MGLPLILTLCFQSESLEPGLTAQGQTKKILPETLISYIWPDSADGSTLRMRRLTLKKALAEIVATDAWEVEPGYLIKRKGSFAKKLKKFKN